MPGYQIKFKNSRVRAALALVLCILLLLPQGVGAALIVNRSIMTNTNLTSGLLAYYKFDGASPLTDSSGNGNTLRETASVAGGTVTEFLVSGTSWVVPEGWNSSDNTIECIGAGGNGGLATSVASEGAGGGGGGGAYAIISNLPLTPNDSITYAIAAGGATTDTYFNGAASTTASLSCATGTSAATSTKGVGSASGNSTGDTINIGGDGGTGTLSVNRRSGAGGGGSGGPTGVGKNGANGSASNSVGASGGGGSNGGTSSAGATAVSATGGAGGNGTSGSGSGAGGSGASGSAGTVGGGGGGAADAAPINVTYNGGDGGCDTAFDATHGACGGGGGGGARSTGGTGTTGNGGDGGTYGGGGGGVGSNGSGSDTLGAVGAGGQGLIVISYTSSGGLGAGTNIQGKVGQGRYFNGSPQYATTTSISSIRSVAFWAKATTGVSQGLVNLTGSSVYISTNASKVLSATGFTSPTYYIDGVASSTPAIYDSNWHYYVVTGTADITGSQLEIARANGAYFVGGFDDARFYNRTLTSAEVLRLFQLHNTFYTSKTIKSDTSLNGSSLVGHWTFDGPKLLQNVADSSGQGNHAFLNGFTSTTTVPGALGQALSFSGTSEVITNSTTVGDFGTNPFSLSLWVKTTSTSNKYLMGKRAGCAHGNFWDLTKTAAGVVTVELDDNNVNYNTFSGAAEVNDGKWHHVGVVRSGTTAYLYIDGVLDTSNSTAGVTNIAANSAPIWIANAGPNGGLCDLPLDGTLDDVRVYNNRALSAAEVKRLYGLGATTHVNKTITSNTALTNGLVGHWTFDGPKLLQNATDSSGQGNTGKLISFTSTTTTAGKIGQALLFDGVDDAVRTTTQYSNPQTFTIAAWIKTATSTTAGRKIIGFEDNPANPGSYDRHLYMGTDGKIYFGWWNGAAVIAVSASAYNDTRWHHVVGTHNGSTGTLYVDGVSVDSDTGTPISYSGYWNIGGYGLAAAGGWTNGNSGYFPGTIDDIRVYSRTLSAAEVLKLYQLGQ